MTDPPRIYHSLQRAAHAARKLADIHLRDTLGITAAQLGVLYAVSATPGCRPSDVSETLGLNASGLTRLVGNLVGDGLLERSACPDDARSSRLSLTDRGRECVARARPLQKRFNELLAGDADPDEIATIARFLERADARLRDALDNPETQP